LTRGSGIKEEVGNGSAMLPSKKLTLIILLGYGICYQIMIIVSLKVVFENNITFNIIKKFYK